MEWLKEDALSEINALKLKRLSTGKEVIDLSMINPDLAPARSLLDRLAELSIKPGNHRYAVSRGVRRLREAFTLKYSSAFKTELSPDRQVCVTMGTKDALPNALSCLRGLGYGNTVLLGSPFYPGHSSAARLAGFTPNFFEIHEDPQGTLASIKSALSSHPGSVVLTNFPNNPLGTTVTKEFWSALVELARSYRSFVLNDFVYGEMCFSSGKAASLLAAAQNDDPCAETYSLSKAYNVPGWRVGALLGHSGLVELLAHLKSHLDYGIFLPLQLASAAALAAPAEVVGATLGAYQARAKTAADCLTRAGFKVRQSEAGACVWAQLPERVRPHDQRASFALARNILAETGVAVSPGALFGEPWCGYLRLALVAPPERLRDCITRIQTFLENKEEGRIGALTSVQEAL